jgi:hypothetical protein
VNGSSIADGISFGGLKSSSTSKLWTSQSIADSVKGSLANTSNAMFESNAHHTFAEQCMLKVAFRDHSFNEVGRVALFIIL